MNGKDIGLNQHAQDAFRHGRTTPIDHHADLQVLKRIRKFLLPKDFEVSQSLLNQMAQGYDIGDGLNLLQSKLRHGILVRVAILYGLDT